MQERNHIDYVHSTKIGVLLGFFAGWAIGIALLLYIGSQELNNWPWVSSIPLWNGFGWALFGFIVGGGGVFANLGKPKPRGRAEPHKKAA